MNIQANYSIADLGVQLHRFTLQNGLPVVFIEKPFAPIYAQMTMIAGSTNNPSDNGLAHFTEHMVVSASKQLPRKELIAQIINTKGGYSNASTGSIFMIVECEVSIVEHLPDMKKHFSEVLGDIYITPELFKKEKGVITAETLRSLAQPSYVVGRKMRFNISGVSPWSYSNLGEIDAMQNLTQDDIRLFYETYCCVENMTLVISGGCTIDDVKNTFESINLRSEGKRAVLCCDPIELAPKRRVFVEDDSLQSGIMIAFNGPLLNTRESLVLKFAMDFAHSGLDSLFLNKIRNQRGLAYAVSAPCIVFNTLQYLGSSLTCSPEKVDESIESVFECYSDLRNSGMTAEQIEARISREYFKSRRHLETAESWVKEFNRELIDAELSLVGDYPDILNVWKTITPDEISAVLKNYLVLENFHIFLSGRQCNTKFF